MSHTSPEKYVKSLIGELEAAYHHYNLVRDRFSAGKKNWKRLSLNNYLMTEKESMSRIRIREKTLTAWLKDHSMLASSLSEELLTLESLRKKTVRENALLMNEIRSVMNSLKQEQKSLRVPRSKPIRKESVPTLIDIKL